MAHTIRDKTKLLNRIRRIRGQIDAVERAIEAEHDCSAILHAIAACHGAIKGLMAEVIEGHIQGEIISACPIIGGPLLSSRDETYDSPRRRPVVTEEKHGYVLVRPASICETP
jgi:DNA-binding FrmR family transcriptional regulator